MSADEEAQTENYYDASGYAYVRYLEDNVMATVKIFDIKGGLKCPFHPKKKYMVRWHDKEDREHLSVDDYFEAEVLYVAETEECLNRQINAKRLKLTNKQLLISASESDCSEDKTSKVFKAKKKQAKPNLPVLYQTQIMEKFTNSQPKRVALERNAMPKDIEKLKTQAMEKCTNSKPKSVALERNGMPKDLEKSKILQTENSKLKKELKQAQTELTDLKCQNKKITTLNETLQRSVIDGVQDLLNQFGNAEARAPPTNLYPPIGKRTIKNTHVGQNIWLQNQVVDSLLCANPDLKDKRKLVINLAVILFGRNVLCRSSVFGSKPNIKKNALAKPSLDPKVLLAITDFYKWWLGKKGVDVLQREHLSSKVPCFINSKISDLNRKEREPRRSLAVHDMFDAEEVDLDENKEKDNYDDEEEERDNKDDDTDKDDDDYDKDADAEDKDDDDDHDDINHDGRSGE